jgi:signal transduction histidine kinase
MRTRIASDLHDEVGSMLSGLAMQAELMEMNPQANHSQTLAYLRNTSREAVSKMRDLVWSIDSRRDLVKNLLDRMREYAEEILPAKGIEYRFQLGELDMDQKLPSETRQHLYFIFKEAVNNVARHSNADKVTVVFGNFADECRLEIRDNGCVESEQLPKSGLGISNIQMRAKKLQAKLSIASDNGFCILLRLRKI